ncbi:MFS transporter [Streptomyces lydicus]|uniref:MFS transporter n=1 Tax=Streptomyces lydicus TaxID=47763 RepID=UPI0037031117
MTSLRHRRLVLTGSITGAVIVALDGTVLTVAQPTLQRTLHATFAQVQWTSTGYLIAVASLLVFAGRLGDRYGHQRLFALGILGFGAASAGIGLATDVGWVIALRIVQGISGALLQPATLGMLRAAYPPDRLGMPLALRTSAIGLAAAAGPLLGGALVAQLGWRAVFFLNVPPALLTGALALAVRVPPPLPTPPSRPLTGLDLPGAGLLGITLVCLVHTLVALPAHGWTTTTTAAVLAAAVAFAAFVHHERRTASPLVPPRVAASKAVASSLAVLLAASAALFGTLFVSSYYLQNVRHLDPFRCGLQVLPLPLLMVLSAPASAVLQRRYGPRRTTTVAMALLTLGTLLLSRLDDTSTPLEAGTGFLLLGAGFGTVMVTATAVIVRHAPVDNAGVAGGLQQTAMNIGPTLGVATATMLLTYTPTLQSTLLPLTALAALGTLCATALPAGSAREGNSQPDPATYPQEGASETI